MHVIINPGSGPVPNARLKHAWSNIRAFRRELAFANPKITIERDPAADRNGRYGFVLRRGEHVCDVDMPGLALEFVRWIDDPGQNIWDFPRLYVDGSSWVWKYAIDQAHDALDPQPEAE